MSGEAQQIEDVVSHTLSLRMPLGSTDEELRSPKALLEISAARLEVAEAILEGGGFIEVGVALIVDAGRLINASNALSAGETVHIPETGIEELAEHAHALCVALESIEGELFGNGSVSHFAFELAQSTRRFADRLERNTSTSDEQAHLEVSQ